MVVEEKLVAIVEWLRYSFKVLGEKELLEGVHKSQISKKVKVKMLKEETYIFIYREGKMTFASP